MIRLLLRCYPASFRNEYGEEIRRVFERRLRDADGSAARAGVYVSEIAGTVAAAARVHADILQQDLRHTRRSLWRARGFAAAAIAVTALGVGATTAVFSVADHVLVRPLPYADPASLVKIWESTPGYGRIEASPANVRDWQQMSSSFSAMGAFTEANASVPSCRQNLLSALPLRYRAHRQRCPWFSAHRCRRVPGCRQQPRKAEACETVCRPDAASGVERSSKR